MADPFSHFKGKIILHAMITAQEGQADRAQSLLKDIQEHALSDKEPGALRCQYANGFLSNKLYQHETGCLTYRIARSGNDFIVFEEFENSAAIKLHNESPPIKAMQAEAQKGDSVATEPKLGSYEEV
ncbi:hypothetical protein FRC09_006473 [Ceratobasidium sp. 395]|nr:hypothetical protein FRC09_006473 [Ceratobasidium sp. 395]